MVKTINVTTDDDIYAEIKEVKDRLGLTWEEFFIEAGKCLSERAKSG